MLQVIPFRRVKDPYGWMSNMSPHPVSAKGKTWRTTEALFQALRFANTDFEAIDAVWEQASPMGAKMVAKKYSDRFVVAPRSPQDLDLMRWVLRLKLEQHPNLLLELKRTGRAEIIEDVTARPNESGLFWGAVLKEGVWVGQNQLGKLWMEIRGEVK